MKRKNRLTVLFMLLAIACAQTATAKAVWDFEDCAIGQKFKMWNLFGSEAVTSSAVVEADPQNPNNKVLHVIVKEWNTFVEFTLPDELAGHKLTDNAKSVKLNLYRPNSDSDNWKQFHVFLGS